MPSGTLGQHMLIAGHPAGYTSVNFQRIHVEKTFSVQLHASQGRIVEFQFYEVRIPSFGTVFQHPAGKKHHRHGGAGFAVAAVSGQIVVHGEGFMMR